MKQWKSIFLILLFSNVANGQEVSSSEVATSVTKEETSSYLGFYTAMVRDFKGELTDKSYFMKPESLRVTTQAFGLGYQWNENWSAGLSSQYIKNEITLRSAEIKQGPAIIAPSRVIEDSTEGISDTLLSVRYRQPQNSQSSVTYSLGLSIPTGDYKKADSKGRYLSYSAQLGSGTYDVTPEISYRGRFEQWTITGRAFGKIRTGRNDLEYRLGDEIRLQGSVAYSVTRYLAFTVGGYYKNWREVVGSENISQHNAGLSSSSSRSRPSGMRPTAGFHGSGGNPFAGYNMTGDAFAASGARWAAQMGVRSGIYLGPILKGVFELGVPVAYEEIGELEGLKNEWYFLTALQSSF
ncbi:MAG: transporter [Bdellovibrionales bacterium]|nr:transporter [Bdellovibrionales bacterium]